MTHETEHRSRGSRLQLPSPAIAVSVVALVVALTGSAYAVSSTINGSELTNRSVTAVKLVKHTLTAAEINAATVGLVQGPGHRSFGRVVLTPAATGNKELLRLPGLVDVTGGCFNSTTPPTGEFTFTNLTGTTLDVVRSIILGGAVDPITGGFTLAPAAQAVNGSDAPASDVMRFGVGSGASAKVAVVTTWFNNDGGTCRIDAEADYSG